MLSVASHLAHQDWPATGSSRDPCQVPISKPLLSKDGSRFDRPYTRVARNGGADRGRRKTEAGEKWISGVSRRPAPVRPTHTEAQGYYALIQRSRGTQPKF